MIAAIFLLAATDVDAPMSRVTVYSDRAEVTRRADIACDAGTADVTLPPIPGHAEASSVRVELGQGEARLTSLLSEVVTKAVAVDPRKAALEKERDGVRQKLEALRDSLKTLDEREAALEKLGQFFATAANEDVRNPKPLVEQWKKTLDTLKNERAAAAAKRLQWRAEQRAETRKLGRIEKKLALLGEDLRAVRVVTARIACGGEKRVPLTFAYVLSGARWWPEYDLRVEADTSAQGDSKAELSVSALVQQTTGEDWKDVEIVLSTAQPALGAQALVPQVVIVDGMIQQQKKVLVQQSERRAQALEQGATNDKEAAGADLEDGGRVFTFKLKQKPSIPSDGHEVWFQVDAVPFTASIGRVATPTLMPYVYRVAKQKNPASYPLIAGTLHVFRQRAFMGDMELKYVAPGEPFEVSLGIDESMRVERRPLVELDRAPKLLGSTKAWERHYRVRLQNLGDKPTTVELREAIPLSKAKDVTVEIGEKTTADYQHDKDRGFLVWRVPVERVKEIDLAYTVKIPKEWQTP